MRFNGLGTPPSFSISAHSKGGLSGPFSPFLQVLKTESLERNRNSGAVSLISTFDSYLRYPLKPTTPGGRRASATSSSSATSASQYPTAVRETSGIKISRPHAPRLPTAVTVACSVIFYFSTGCKGAGLEDEGRVFYDSLLIDGGRDNG